MKVVVKVTFDVVKVVVPDEFFGLRFDLGLFGLFEEVACSCNKWSFLGGDVFEFVAVSGEFFGLREFFRKVRKIELVRGLARLEQLSYPGCVQL